MSKPLPVLLALCAATFLFGGEMSGQSHPDLPSLTPAGKEHCLHFANFCDTITLEKTRVLASGGWDYQCGGDWYTVNIIGNTNNPAELATHPYEDDFPPAYTTQISFKTGKVFDLDVTEGIGSGVTPFRINEPYSITDGACTIKDVDRGKPRLMSGVESIRTVGSNAQTQDYCLHFTNFCDTIMLQTSGTFAYGAWDWQCRQDWVNSPIMGHSKAGKELGTRPRESEYYLSPYSMHFSFNPGNLFDLYGTAGLGQGVFAIRTNQPFTITGGSCSARDVNLGKPRLMSH
jgi:hypothetical protein